MRYIDAHAHLGPWFDAQTTLDPDAFVALQERAGIERTVVSSTSALFTELTYGNDWTLAHVEVREHLLAWLVLNPMKMTESAELLARYADHPRVVGIKLHPVLHRYPADMKETFRLLERLEPLGLPILSHAENDSYAAPARLRRLAEGFPTLPLIAAHFAVATAGHAAPGIEAIQDCRSGNLCTDMGTARAIQTGVIEQVVRAVGAERVLFGTDSPLYEPMAFPALLSAAAITDAERQLVAWGNAERLILQPRGLN